MDMEEMGNVVSYMLQHRIVETKPAGRHLRDGEAEVARSLVGMTLEDRQELDGFFSGMKLSFFEYSDINVPSIPKGERVFILARDLVRGAPSRILSDKVVLKDMKDKDNESDRDASVWFVHLWLVHLELLYTDKGRAPVQLQRFAEGVFDFDVFLEKVRDHFEDLRNSLDRKEIAENAAFRIFEKASQAEVERRCRRFVKLMLDAGLLARLEKDQYQQTILSAHEIKRNYNAGLSNFFSTDEVVTPVKAGTAILTNITDGESNPQEVS